MIDFINGGPVKLTLRSELDIDGRWLAEVVQLPYILAFGSTSTEALAAVQALALRHIAGLIEQESLPLEVQFEIDKSAHGECRREPDPEDPEAHAAWLEAEIQDAIDDDGPTIPHEEAMRHIRTLLNLN
jgi:predicted RNase H-like HicB family nuclease